MSLFFSQILFFFFLLFPLFLQSRRRNLHETQIHKIRLYGNSQLGYYYMNLFIGSNFQRQTVIIDTGSWVTSFPCSSCKATDCGAHMDNPFNLRESKSSKIISCADKIENYQCEACSQYNNLCIFNIEYMEGSSMNGFFVEDIVIMGDELMELIQTNQTENPIAQNYIEKEKAKFAFGCTTKETKLIKKQEADGIIGLGINSNTSSRIPNLIDYTFASHHQEKLEFSMCLSNKDGGFISIGGYNTAQHISNQTFIVPISRTSKQYNIKIHSLKIDDEDMELNVGDFESGQGSFLDTGTTLFFAHSKIYKKIMKKFESFCHIQSNCQGRQSNSKCYFWNKMSFPNLDRFFDTFPKLEFEMDNNFTFVWEPRDYFYSDDNLVYCLPFEEIEERVILGAIFLRNYDVLFDRTDREIHFTRSDCDKNSKEIFLNLNYYQLNESNKNKSDENQQSIIKENFNIANITENNNQNYNISQYNSNISLINSNIDLNLSNQNNSDISLINSNIDMNLSNESMKNENISENNEENFSIIQENNNISQASNHESSNITNNLTMPKNDNGSLEMNLSISQNDQISPKTTQLEKNRKDLLIILCALGVIFILGLIAFIIIKLKKHDIYKKEFGRVQASARESKENSQVFQTGSELKDFHLNDMKMKDVYSIEDVT